MAFFDDRNLFVIDPLEAEEDACDGHILVAGNSYGELTAVHVTGQAQLTEEIVMRCCSTAMERIKKLTTELKTALAEDKAQREGNSKQGYSFSYLIRQNAFVLSERYKPGAVEVVDDEVIVEKDIPEVVEAQRTKVYRFGSKRVYGIGEGGPSQWDIDDMAVGEEEEEEEKEDDVQVLETQSPPKKKAAKAARKDESSDEEVTELMLE